MTAKMTAAGGAALIQIMGPRYAPHRAGDASALELDRFLIGQDDFEDLGRRRRQMVPFLGQDIGPTVETDGRQLDLLQGWSEPQDLGDPFVIELAEQSTDFVMGNH
jgi:hypothetical protein